MTVKLLTEHNLEFHSLKGGCTGSCESIHVKIPHCYKSHVAAQYFISFAELCEFRNDLLDVQNIHRYRHGCPELILSNLLSRDSQEWASRLALMGYAQYSELSGMYIATFSCVLYHSI